MKKILVGAVLAAAALVPAAGFADESECVYTDHGWACLNSYMQDEGGYKADFFEVQAGTSDGTFVAAFAGSESYEPDNYRGTGGCYYANVPGAEFEDDGCLAVLQYGSDVFIVTPAGDVDVSPDLP